MQKNKPAATVEIINAEPADFNSICQLFEQAILFQKKNNYIGWASYDKDCIKKDIEQKRLYKLVRAKDLLGIFSICYSDELIWQDKEKADAIYIHRVLLNQQFKGLKIFQYIINWAMELAAQLNRRFIRIDTWANNEKIINYYKSYGFKFIENYTTPGTAALPIQHRDLKVALLELNLQKKLVPLQGTYQTTPQSLTKINIPQELSAINKYWSQKIIGQANGQLIKLAKGIGEINWHKHDDQDELFILYKGHLTIQLREQDIDLYENELFIVPKGIEHCPKANGEVEFLIMGLNITSNTAGGRPEKWSQETVAWNSTGQPETTVEQE